MSETSLVASFRSAGPVPFLYHHFLESVGRWAAESPQRDMAALLIQLSSPADMNGWFLRGDAVAVIRTLVWNLEPSL